MNDVHAIRIELAKIKQESDTLAKEFAVVNSQVTIRKIELSVEGRPNKPNNTTDEKLLFLLARSKVDRGAWRAAVPRVTKGWTQLSN